MFQNLTLNSILIMLFGLGIIVLGIWSGLAGARMQGAGFVFTGLGTAILGFTNGFVDLSPQGRFLFRAAIVSFLIGIPITLYYLFLFISRE
jgi:hypothetical protein